MPSSSRSVLSPELEAEALAGIEEAEDLAEEPPPSDEADRLAAWLVGALLDQGLLELAAPRSRAQVEGRLAHNLASGVRDPARLSAAIIACSGVAELYADDERIGSILHSWQERAFD